MQHLCACFVEERKKERGKIESQKWRLEKLSDTYVPIKIIQAKEKKGQSADLITVLFDQEGSKKKRQLIHGT